MTILEISNYYGLSLGPFDDQTTERDIKQYARGWLDGMRGERLDALRWRTHRAEAKNEKVCVRWWKAIGEVERDFTFDEFFEWLGWHE